jgi:hypothetical protein
MTHAVKNNLNNNIKMLIPYIKSNAFRLDNILPNYVIFQGLQSSKEDEITLDAILEVVRYSFKKTISLLISSIQKDKIPKKNSIS